MSEITGSRPVSATPTSVIVAGQLSRTRASPLVPPAWFEAKSKRVACVRA